MHACQNDIPGIIELMKRAYAKSPQKNQAYNESKASLFLQQWVLDPKSSVLINNSITACHIVTLQPTWWSEKLEAIEVFFYSETPGAGFRLMKKNMQWVNNFKARVSCMRFGSTFGKSETDSMLERLGFDYLGKQFMMELQ